MLRHLDRLCRTLHTLNYFAEVDESQLLFLNVEQRLLTSVPGDHGEVFKGILATFNLSPRRIVIVFPRTVTDDPGLLGRQRKTIGHAATGSWFRSAIGMTICSGCSTRLPSTWSRSMSPRGSIRTDLPFGAALGDSGISLLVGRVESADLLKRVMDAKVDLAQGFVLGLPAPLPGAQRCQLSFLIANASSRRDQGSMTSDLL